jgi:long-subunit fatty acid transport protein
MPADRQLRFAAGAQYQWSDRLNVGGNFVFLDAGNAKINSRNLKGDYKSNEVYFFALNASYKF